MKFIIELLMFWLRKYSLVNILLSSSYKKTPRLKKNSAVEKKLRGWKKTPRLKKKLPGWEEEEGEEEEEEEEEGINVLIKKMLLG